MHDQRVNLPNLSDQIPDLTSEQLSKITTFYKVFLYLNTERNCLAFNGTQRVHWRIYHWSDAHQLSFHCLRLGSQEYNNISELQYRDNKWHANKGGNGLGEFLNSSFDDIDEAIKFALYN